MGNVCPKRNAEKEADSIDHNDETGLPSIPAVSATLAIKLKESTQDDGEEAQAPSSSNEPQQSRPVADAPLSEPFTHHQPASVDSHTAAASDEEENCKAGQADVVVETVEVKKDSGFAAAMASGAVKVLRLARLSSQTGELMVESVELPFSDEAFAGVGVCSYTWGFEREDWHDKETGLTWKVSTRAVPMCRAALQHFERVWIDGLCMVQLWPEHIALNMQHMGKIYYHGTVVPELIIDAEFHYSLRGWVQQELSFTNIAYTLKPFVDWMRENSNIVQSLRTGNPLRDNYDEEFAALIKRLLPCINTVIRATESRTAPKAREVSQELNRFMGLLQDDIFSAGGRPQCQDVLIKHLLDIGHVLEGRLERETDHTDICHSALQAFRTGFFRYNSDRKVAAFSLAQYVLDIDDIGMVQRLDSLPPPEPRQYVTINANPGRWCTGLGPECALRSKQLPCEPFLHQRQKYAEDKAHLDHLFAVLHDVPASRMVQAQYLVGWTTLTSGKGERFISCHFGYRPSSDSAYVHALVSVTFAPNQNHVPMEPMYFAHTFFQMELGSKLFGLINASYTVHQLPEEQRERSKLPITIDAIRMLDEDMLEAFCPSRSHFLESMAQAARCLLRNLDHAAELAMTELVNGADATAESSQTLVWGGPDYEHHTIGAASLDRGAST